MPALKKAPMPAKTLETALGEVIEDCAVSTYVEILQKLEKTSPGSARYRSLLCDLSVAADWIEIKVKSAREAIEEYLESLPDDDD